MSGAFAQRRLQQPGFFRVGRPRGIQPTAALRDPGTFLAAGLQPGAQYHGDITHAGHDHIVQQLVTSVSIRFMNPTRPTPLVAAVTKVEVTVGEYHLTQIWGTPSVAVPTAPGAPAPEGRIETAKFVITPVSVCADVRLKRVYVVAAVKSLFSKEAIDHLSQQEQLAHATLVAGINKQIELGLMRTAWSLHQVIEEMKRVERPIPTTNNINPDQMPLEIFQALDRNPAGIENITAILAAALGFHPNSNDTLMVFVPNMVLTARSLSLAKMLSEFPAGERLLWTQTLADALRAASPASKEVMRAHPMNTAGAFRGAPMPGFPDDGILFPVPTELAEGEPSPLVEPGVIVTESCFGTHPTVYPTTMRLCFVSGSVTMGMSEVLLQASEMLGLGYINDIGRPTWHDGADRFQTVGETHWFKNRREQLIAYLNTNAIGADAVARAIVSAIENNNLTDTYLGYLGARGADANAKWAKLKETAERGANARITVLDAVDAILHLPWVLNVLNDMAAMGVPVPVPVMVVGASACDMYHLMAAVSGPGRVNTAVLVSEPADGPGSYVSTVPDHVDIQTRMRATVAAAVTAPMQMCSTPVGLSCPAQLGEYHSGLFVRPQELLLNMHDKVRTSHLMAVPGPRFGDIVRPFSFDGSHMFPGGNTDHLDECSHFALTKFQNTFAAFAQLLPRMRNTLLDVSAIASEYRGHEVLKWAKTAFVGTTCVPSTQPSVGTVTKYEPLYKGLCRPQ
jgi:hypothetical protein